MSASYETLRKRRDAVIAEVVALEIIPCPTDESKVNNTREIAKKLREALDLHDQLWAALPDEAKGVSHA